MSENLTLTVDKFTFEVATDRYYNSEGVWAKEEADGRIRIGLSDFVQQRNGDVAFAEVKPVGTSLKMGDETIKVDITFTSPVSGTVVEVNPAMEEAPEAINQDPYGEGWLAVIAAENWESESVQLLPPEEYYSRMKVEAEEEASKL